MKPVLDVYEQQQQQRETRSSRPSVSVLSEVTIIQDIYQALLALNHLYCEASLDEYEQVQQALEKRIQQQFPGFTIAYALEIGIVGTGEAAYHHGGVMHVLFPLEERA